MTRLWSKQPRVFDWEPQIDFRIIFKYTESQELYYLPGHKATVNEVVFHPVEPIIASASSDKTIFLGELA